MWVSSHFKVFKCSDTDIVWKKNFLLSLCIVFNPSSSLLLPGPAPPSLPALVLTIFLLQTPWFPVHTPPPPHSHTDYPHLCFLPSHLFIYSLAPTHTHLGYFFFSPLFSFSATSEWPACFFPLWSRPFSSGVEQIDIRFSSSAANHPKAGWLVDRAARLRYCGAHRWSSQAGF